MRHGNSRSSSTNASGDGEKPVDVGHLSRSRAPRGAAKRRGAGFEAPGRDLRQGAAGEDRGHDHEAAGRQERQAGEALSHRAAGRDRRADAETDASGEALAPGRPALGALSATAPFRRAASQPPASTPRTSAQVPRRERCAPAAAETRPVVPGTTARPKFRPASADAGQATVAATPTQIPVLRQSHAPARPGASRERTASSSRPEASETTRLGVQEAALGIACCRAVRSGASGPASNAVAPNAMPRTARSAPTSPAPSLYQTPAAQPPAQRIESAEQEPAGHGGDRAEGAARRDGRGRSRRSAGSRRSCTATARASALTFVHSPSSARAEAGVHAEGAPLRAVAEGDSHHERAEQRRESSRRLALGDRQASSAPLRDAVLQHDGAVAARRAAS